MVNKAFIPVGHKYKVGEKNHGLDRNTEEVLHYVRECTFCIFSHDTT